MHDENEAGSSGAAPGSPTPPEADGSSSPLTLLSTPRRLEGADANPRTRAPEAPRSPGATAAAGDTDWLDTVIEEVLDLGARPDAVLPLPARTALPIAAEHTEFADISAGQAASAVLGQVLLGYSPIIEPLKGVIATRLTVVPVRASASIDAGALLETIAEVWPAGSGVVSLNVASELLLSDLLRATPDTNVMIEVPAFIAADPAHAQALIELARRDCVLLLKGRPLIPLPRAVLPCFKWSIIDTSEERRGGAADAPQGVTRSIPHIQAGVRTMAELRRSFARGAIAVIGWPLHEPILEAREAQPDMRVVLDALNRIDRGDSADAVDHVLMRDPMLALELLQHVSGAQSSLSVETGSMRHAVSMLGHERLRRWLAGVLNRSSDDISLRPANFAALRRGLLMRMLAAGTGQQDSRGELFMCGVFSLLDRIYAQPLDELLGPLALPERVRAALVDRTGPHFPLLELARAVESEVPHDIRAASEAVFVPPIEFNRALLRTLLVASHLERPATPAAAP